MKQLRILAGAVTLPAALAAQNPKTQPTTHKPQPTGAAITAGDLETRLYIYAADSMEGRETGTRGHVRATDYIAAQVKALGLVPMGDNGTYFQNVPVIRRSLDPASTISAPGVTLHAGTDFIGTGRGNVRSLAEAPIIYGGVQGDTTGALTPEQVQGKIIAYRAPAGAGRGRGGFGVGALVAAVAVAATAPVRPSRARRRARSRSPISFPRRRFAPQCTRAKATYSSKPMRVIRPRLLRSPSRAPLPSSYSVPRSTEWPRARPARR